MQLANIIPFPKKAMLVIPTSVKRKNKAVWEKFAYRPVISLGHKATVEKIIQETPDTISLTLVLESPRVLEGVQPGQFVTCSFRIDGKDYKRAYSVSKQCNDHSFRITVKKMAKGVVSNYIHDKLLAGDTIQIKGISGEFTANQKETSKIFIAAGCGITPVLPLLEAHLITNHTTPCYLVYSSQTAKDTLFKKTLDRLAKTHPNFHYHLHLTQAANNAFPNQSPRLNHEKLETLLREMCATPITSNLEAFVCGPNEFIKLGESVLQTLGLKNHQIKHELFLNTKRDTLQLPTTTQEIYFPKYNKHVLAKPGQTLLEAGLAAGVPMNFSCQMGGCGHCKVKASAGDVVSEHPNCLSKEEEAQGYRLACVSYACTSTTVEDCQ